ncbi:MAG TPA: indole-3-glycerol phosphate synthase TrpC [Pyrinomonadaceae bacterium]|jgi:indole-3-glycerol phosphate synthase|nr:indole-3-glycerol phosphate synthase TrpC [Pyrinomonadaceae bacterium]
MASNNFLAEIIEKKKGRLERRRIERPLDALRVEALRVRQGTPSHSFSKALSSSGQQVNVIAEFKRASPSKGIIRADFSPVDAAHAYEQGGAVAISVLTEEDYFKGSLEDLGTVRASVALPVLRKDFIFDEYQVYEAAAAGADAVLLIVAALEDQAILSLSRLAEDALGMDVLLEVHTEGEMERSSALGARVVGVNNRDLHTFEVSLDTSVRLARRAREGALLISESGLRTREDLRRLRDCGYGAFLIGETLMRSERPEEALRELVGTG